MSYQNSEQHIRNALAAREKALATKIECPFCHIVMTKSGFLLHSGKCLHDPENQICCKECNTQIFKKETKFCSRSCAANYNNRHRTVESRQKQAKSVSKTLLKRPSPLKGIRKIKPATRKCLVCPVIFELKYKTSTKRYCSPSCASASNTHKWGRCLAIPYQCKAMNQKITLQSNWELKVAKTLDEFSIIWIRPDPILWVDRSGKNRKYFPDFYLPKHDLYLDPKNSKVMKRDEEKLEAVQKKIDLVVGDISIILNVVQAIGFEQMTP